MLFIITKVVCHLKFNTKILKLTFNSLFIFCLYLYKLGELKTE